MSSLLIIEPMPVAVTSARGSGAANLATLDPKEVWVDGAAGTTTILTVDLGSVRSIDTILLGCLGQAAPAATWSVTAGVPNAGGQVLQAETMLRVPDAAGAFASRSHALWHGGVVDVRYLAISVTQPAGSPALTAGVLVVGLAFSAELNHEWGAGRRLIDTGVVTPLPSGGFAVVEGVRKRALKWTFGDLTTAEVDRLEAIALARGERHRARRGGCEPVSRSVVAHPLRAIQVARLRTSEPGPD